MKYIGYLLLIVGFILTALVSVVDKELVKWAHYIPSLLLGVVGVVALRVASHRHEKGEDKVGADIETIDQSMRNIATNMDSFNRDKTNINVYDIHKKVDELFVDDIENFLEARESIIHQYDMQSYADLMSHFAAGERYLNRVWSASADGYVDEVNAYIEKASEQFTIAKDHFDQLKSGSLQPTIE